jgi:hypothetical protein
MAEAQSAKADFVSLKPGFPTRCNADFVRLRVACAPSASMREVVVQLSAWRTFSASERFMPGSAAISSTSARQAL